MHTPLLARVLRHAAHQADRDGIAPTPIAGLVAIRANGRSALTTQIARLTSARTAYEELAEAYEGLRRMVERGYVGIR